MVSDTGFNPYTGLLFTHGDTIRDNPELVEKVVRASVRGWKDFLPMILGKQTRGNLPHFPRKLTTMRQVQRRYPRYFR